MNFFKEKFFDFVKDNFKVILIVIDNVSELYFDSEEIDFVNSFEESMFFLVMLKKFVIGKILKGVIFLMCFR